MKSFSFGRRAPDATTGRLPGYRQWDVTQPLAGAPDVDAVVHCVAHVGDWGDEAHFRAVNVEGTRRTLATFGGARVVHVSSSSVYSDQARTEHVREDAPIGDCPRSAYARTKAEAESLVRAIAPGAVVLRPHIVYGPGDTTLLPRLVAARRLGWLCVPGNGATHVSVTHVGNLTMAVHSALERPWVSGAFNISHADHISVDALLRVALARAGVPVRIAYMPTLVARGLALLLEGAWRTGWMRGAPPLTHYPVGHLTREHTLDTSRARELLDYSPGWSVRDSWEP